MGLFCVNTADTFDGMKNDTLGFTLLQRRPVISTDTRVHFANTSGRRGCERHANTCTVHGHLRNRWHVMYAGTALKCMSLSVYLCQPLCASHSHASLLLERGSFLGTAASIVGSAGSLSEVCSSHHYLQAQRLIRQQWKQRNTAQTEGECMCVNRGDSRLRPSFMWPLTE